MTTTIEIRPVSPSDHAGAAAALSAAFFDDPVFRWIYPDDERRRAVLPEFFTIYTATIARHGASLIGGDAVGAALWVPPGEEVVDDDEAEAFGESLAVLSPYDVERFTACMTVLGDSHPADPCWFLNLVGVLPEQQCRGIGSSLLRTVLDRCDADGVGAYVEATSTENRRLYARHGFRVVSEIPLPDGPSLWGMWREPRLP